MKKIIAATALVLLSVSLIWYMRHRQINKKVLPKYQLETLLTNSNTLLVCTNIRSCYIKNEWGDLQLQAQAGSISRDHIIRATSVHISLKRPDSPVATITADGAILATSNNMLSLAGSVHAEQKDMIAKSDKLFFDLKNKLVSASGNVRIRNSQGKITADQVEFDQQAQKISAQGKVKTTI